MTTTEFLSALSDIRDQFHWSLTPDTGRHADRRRKQRLHIRGTPISDTSISLDPLRVLCFSRTGTILGNDDKDRLARALDMTISEVSMVLSAANDQTWTGAGENRAPSDQLLTLRNALLVAIGLQIGVQG